MLIDTAHVFASGGDVNNIPDVEFIHLNGNQTKQGSGSDKHAECASRQDLLFTKDTLKEFIKKNKDAVMILERGDDGGCEEEIKMIKGLLWQQR